MFGLYILTIKRMNKNRINNLIIMQYKKKARRKRLLNNPGLLIIADKGRMTVIFIPIYRQKNSNNNRQDLNT